MNIKSKLSNYILKVTTFLYSRKDKLRKSSKTGDLLWNALLIILGEIYLVLISLPTYIFVGEQELKKEGFDDNTVRSYKLRKRISLSTITIGVLFIVVRIGILFVTSVWFGRFLGIQASTVNLDFASRSDYISSKEIQITDGMAVLKKDKKSEECSGYVYTKDPIVVTNLDKWTDFVEVAQVGTGTVGYQLSLDSNNTWIYWDGSAWVGAVDDTKLNTANELSENIGSISSENNSISVKAVLYGSCEGDVKLLDMGVGYEIEKLLVSRHTLDSIEDNSVSNKKRLSIVDGVDGNAIKFEVEEGEGGTYLIDDPRDGTFSPQMITASIWVYPTERKTSMILDKGGWKSPYSVMQDKWEGWTVNVKIDGNDYKLQSGDEYMSLNEWNLVSFSYDEATFKLYVNDSLVKSLDVSGKLDSNNYSLYLGSETRNSKFFEGYLDDFRLYNYALSLSEIEELYSHLGDNNGGGGDDDIDDPIYPESLIFNIDEGSGSVSMDSTDSAQLSLIGSKWAEGISNSGLYYDNYGDRFDSNLSYLDYQNQSVISFWFNAEKENTGGLLKIKDSNDGNIYYLGYSDLEYELDTWNNVIVYLNSGTSEVYLNGEKVDGVQTGYDKTKLNTLQISGDDVYVDELRVYNMELTDDLLVQLSNEYAGSSLYQIIGEIEGVSFVNEAESLISETDGYIGVKMNSVLVAELTISDNLDTSVLVVDNSDEKSLLHFDNKESIETVRLLLPKNNPQSSVRVCPGVTELEDIRTGCTDEIILTTQSPTSAGYTLDNLDDDDFWYITSTVDNFSTGAQEFTQGLVAHWTLDDTQRDTIVDTQNGLVGTVEGTVTYTSGMKSGAAQFVNELNNNDNNFFTVPHSDVLNLGNQGSVCTWVYLDESLPYQGFVHKGGNGDFSDAEYALQAFATGREFVFNVVSDGDRDMYIQTSPKSLDTWYFVCGTYIYESGSTNIKIYVDGNLERSQSFNYAPGVDDGSLQIGAQLYEVSTWNGSRYGRFALDGLLDEVRIYNVEIDQQAIQDLMELVSNAEIEITSPNGGSYLSGTTMQIEWMESETSGSFDILYSSDGFNNVNQIIAESITDTSFNWQIPTGINGDIEIRIQDSMDSNISDISDSYISIQDPISDTGLIWRFDEAGGCNFVDDSSTYTGILGNSCNSDNPDWNTDGLLNSTLSYSDDDYSSIPNENIFNPTTGLTLSTWVRWDIDPTQGNNWAQIINKDDDDQYQIQHNSDNTGFEFALRTTQTRWFIIGDTQPQQGEWYMVTATYDGSEMKLYVNGELEASASISGDIVSSDSDIFIGQRERGDRNFDGSIDEFRFYNYPLDQSDILNIYLSDLSRAPEIDIDQVLFENNLLRIDYTVLDQNNDNVSLLKYEYSIDGINWSEMTPDYSTGMNSGISGLLADDDGESYTFVWNSIEDLGFQYYENINIRMQCSDGLKDSEISQVGNIEIDNKGPEISDLNISQSTDNGKVYISYIVDENSLDNIVTDIEISDDLGNSWNVNLQNISGDYGIVNHTVNISEYEIVWDVIVDYPNIDNKNLQAKISIEDIWGNSSEYLSSLFEIDSKAPFGISNFQALANAEYSVLLTWDGIEQEENFDRYQILYSTDSNELESKLGYIEVEDTTLLNIDSESLLITNLEANTQYYFLLIANDIYGNITELPIVSTTTLKEIDIDQIVLDSDKKITNAQEVLVYGISVPNEYVTLNINGDEFTQWALADELGYFEKVIDFEEGQYTMSVYFQDIARRIDSNELEITIDRTAPTVSSLDFDIVDDLGYVNLSGQTDPNTEIVIYINDTPYPISTILSDNQGLWSQEIFVSDTLYDAVITVRSVDLAGNESLPSTPVVLPSFDIEQGETLLDDEAGVITTGAVNSIDNGDIIEDSVSREIFEYRVSRLVDTPEVLSVNQNQATGTVVFGGKGIPNSDVILFVHSDQAFAVKTSVNENGYWDYTHTPEDLVLENGDHEVYAVTVDSNSNVRSNGSNVFGFKVDTTPLILILNYINIPTTVIAVLILGSAIFLVVYSRNKFGKVADVKKETKKK